MTHTSDLNENVKGSAAADPETIRATYRFLAHTAHGVSEVRVIRPGGGIAGIGFFDNEDDFVAECLRTNAEGNVYAGIQARPQRLLEKAPNRLAQIGHGAIDADIEWLTSLVIDIDPVRAPGTASTEAELAAAMETADAAAAWAESNGFVRPVRNMSGNGCQLWFALPPHEVTADSRDDATRRLKAFEARLREQFATEAVKIDSIYNLSRIIKVIGTRSVKGKPSDERPHRVSAALDSFTRHEDPKLLEHILALPLVVPEAPSPMDTTVWSKGLVTIGEELSPRVQHLIATAKTVETRFAGRGKPGVSQDGRSLDTSSSGYDFSLALMLIKKGVWDRNELATALWHRPDGVARAKGADYCGRTADRALALTSRERTADVAFPDTEMKDGVVRPVRSSYANFEALLQHEKIEVRYNCMKHRQEITSPQGIDSSGEMQQEANLDVVRRAVLKRNLAIKEVDGGLARLSMQPGNAYHPVVDWIASRPWDGRDRLPDLLATIQLSPKADPALSVQLIYRWLLTAAAAVTVPYTATEGISAQGMLVLQGEQGIGKTRWFGSLVPVGSNWFKDGVVLNPSDKDSVQKAAGYWLVELGDLDATFKKSEIAHLKAFLTENTDVYRPPYGRRAGEFARRTVFCASVNPESFLSDTTGNRRYWTVPVAAINPDHGIDMQQLWAQMDAAVRIEPLAYLLPREVEAALKAGNRKHEERDAIEETLEAVFVKTKARRDPAYRTSDWTPWSDIVAKVKEKTGLTGWSGREGRTLARALRQFTGETPWKTHGMYLWPVKCAEPPGFGQRLVQGYAAKQSAQAAQLDIADILIAKRRESGNGSSDPDQN